MEFDSQQSEVAACRDKYKGLGSHQAALTFEQEETFTVVALKIMFNWPLLSDIIWKVFFSMQLFSAQLHP